MGYFGGGERVRVFDSTLSLSVASFSMLSGSPEVVVIVGSTAAPLAEMFADDNVVTV